MEYRFNKEKADAKDSLLHTIIQLEQQLEGCKHRGDWDNCAATCNHIASLYLDLERNERQA